jgi:hypothetical protein
MTFPKPSKFFQQSDGYEKLLKSTLRMFDTTLSCVGGVLVADPLGPTTAFELLATALPGAPADDGFVEFLW